MMGVTMGDLMTETFLVRTMKTFLRAFSQMYHEGELDTREVGWCLEILESSGHLGCLAL